MSAMLRLDPGASPGRPWRLSISALPAARLPAGGQGCQGSLQDEVNVLSGGVCGFRARPGPDDRPEEPGHGGGRQLRCVAAQAVEHERLDAGPGLCVPWRQAFSPDAEMLVCGCEAIRPGQRTGQPDIQQVIGRRGCRAAADPGETGQGRAQPAEYRFQRMPDEDRWFLRPRPSCD